VYNVIGMRKSRILGFTLIEMMITIGVVAVLSAGVMSLIGPSSRQSARDTRRQTDLQSIASALAMYRNDNGQYPTATGLLEPNYISVVPPDPLAGSGRLYPYFPKNASDNACDGTPSNRCVKFVLCAAGEKVTTEDAACAGLDCGSTCSLSTSSL
jgi:prepilin-type N-terminal cleavage/methylation domain-containing protein